MAADLRDRVRADSYAPVPVQKESGAGVYGYDRGLQGFLEYMTSLIMEIATGGLKWWDYSGYFLNLNGRICAEGLLVFGIGGLAITYAIAPMVDNLVSRVNEKATESCLCRSYGCFFRGCGLLSDPSECRDGRGQTSMHLSRCHVLKLKKIRMMS